MVIFHSYVKLPEGKFNFDMSFSWLSYSRFAWDGPPQYYVQRGNRKHHQQIQFHRDINIINHLLKSAIFSMAKCEMSTFFHGHFCPKYLGSTLAAPPWTMLHHSLQSQQLAEAPQRAAPRLGPPGVHRVQSADWSWFVSFQSMGGTSKSSSLDHFRSILAFSIIKHPFWDTPMYGTPLFLDFVGKTHSKTIDPSKWNHCFGGLAPTKKTFCFGDLLFDIAEKWPNQLSGDRQMEEAEEDCGVSGNDKQAMVDWNAPLFCDIPGLVDV